MEQRFVYFSWIFYQCCWLYFTFVNGQSNVDLRLSLGYEGLLEVYYNGTWGYVCSNGWDEKDSNVACRNLGFGNLKSFEKNYYHPNQTNEEFKITDVNCIGNENRLLGCNFSTTVNLCSYYRHIYLDCNSDHCQSYLHAEYSAQLVRYFNGVDWFYVCKDNFSEKNAHVICYENYGTEALNYTFLSSSSLAANYSVYPYQFNCEGEEASLCNCPTLNQTCESSEFVAVLCKKKVASEGTIRLTNDDDRFLQAYINSEWIFVCTAYYYYYSYSDNTDLNYYLSHAMGIACRELGYSKVKYFQLNYYYNQQNSVHLGFCPRNAPKLSDCNNFQRSYCRYRISLSCEAETCATSLQFNSTSNSYQLAQTYIDNSWFYICPDSFTKYDADVICRNSELPGSISFGHVSLGNLTQVYPISPNSYDCTGNESSLCSCPSDNSICNSSTAVNVLCHEPNNGSIRLSNGYNGYVEVYNGEWTLVCDDTFNSIEADVICRSAGFRRADSFSSLYLYDYYYYLNDESIINDVRCFGNETNLLECSYSENSRCYKESIVTCEEDGCESLLRNPASLEAVQIYIDQWYSICEDNFTQQTADIICRENHHRDASNYTFLPIQPSNYPIYPFYFQCDGNENSVCACEMISQQCSSNRIVHVECGKSSNGHLRLSNGTSGILEVYLDGWKRVCSNNYYGTSQAVSNVACRYLGYRDAAAFNSIYFYYYATTTNIFSNPRCFGNETNILECAYDLASRCYYESYISCRTEGCQSYIFGENTSDQPVKMYRDENWYYICSNSISTKEADVICRENGFLNGADSISSIHKSQLKFSYEIYPYNITCNGNESSLCDCSMLQMQCTEGNIAEIRCSQPDQGTLRYSNQYPNMLEIYNNGGWSHICRYNWDIADSSVACRQLGYTRYSRYSYSSTTQIATSYPNNFANVSCDGTESSLVDCSYSNSACQSFVSYYTNYKVLLYCTSGDCEVFAPYATQSYQIVEYFLNQQRYYLCADGFTVENADVVCRDTANTLSINHRAVRLLNLPPNTQIYPLQHSCLGNEEYLCNCSTFQQSCSNGSFVEVKCRTPDQGTLRYSDLYSNVLEIFYNGSWSYICPNSWSSTDSTVACRQLGFTRSTYYSSYYYRTSIATSFLNNFQVSCIGNESSIIDCSYTNGTCYSYSSSSYSYTYYLRLYCTGGHCEVHAPFATERFQIVEYFINQQRYYLCADGFTRENADVVCRETTGTLSTTFRSVSLSDLPLNTQIYPLQHFCFGNESSICNCTTSQQLCQNGSVVEVQCRPPDQGTLRYSDLYSSVLEIFYNGGWSYICPNSWSNADSAVACRQLGFARSTYYSSYYYRTTIATSFLNNLQVSCDGSESSIIDCSYNNDTCYSYTGSNYHYTYYLRLYCTGGDCEVHAPFATERFQIVEYFVNQQRYYLCADGFTAENADAVCRETSNTLSTTFRSVSLSDLPLNTQIYPLQHFCSGNESSICNCTTSQQSCTNGSVVEVQCITPDQGTLRYSDLYTNVLEIFYNGSWSYICPNSWSNTDSAVACRQLGFTRSTSYGYYYYRTSIATSFLNNLQVSCDGSESSIIDCSYANDTCYSYSSSSYSYTYYLRLYCTGGDCEVHAPFVTERFQIVEYFVNQQRYYLCADGFTAENADVVCREISGTLSIAARSVNLSDLPPNTQIYPLQYFCFGNESSICNCTTSQQSCMNGSVVEVKCRAPDQGTLRYSDLYNNVLEIFYNGGWSYICPSNWSNADSTVACRQLGFTRSTGYGSYYYRTSIATSFLNNLQVSCDGSESSIIDCNYINGTCYSYTGGYYTYYLRLYCTGGHCEVHAPFATERFQIVEYFVNQQRYYLCADGFTRENADVVCRETSDTLSITFRSVTLSDLPLNTQIYPLQHFCFGNELSICNCNTSQQSCPNGSVVEVQCRRSPDQGTLRYSDLYSNVLEIFYNGNWSYICPDSWNDTDSAVACRQLGFARSTSYNYYNYYYYSYYSTSAPSFLNNFEAHCNGNESSLIDCEYNNHTCFSTSSRNYTSYAFYYIRYLRLYCTGGDCEVHAPFAAERFQIVEYFVNQQRYYLCADGFTAENADVVCRETSNTLSITFRSVSLSDLPLSTRIYPLQHFCFGDESSICNCTTSQQSCLNGSVVEVQCRKTPEQEQIRLTSLNKLQFYYNQWRDICSQRWDIEDSDVACRQLGYRNSVSSTLIYNYYYYYQLDNFVTDVTCFGNETQLSECRYHLASYCSSYYTISLTCQNGGCESYAPNTTSYPQVVRYYSGRWYHLCGDGFTQENADVVCRENEGSTSLSHSNVSNSDLASGLQILERRFTCTGRETSLCDCSSSVESCPSDNVVQLQCNTPAYGHIRLANRDSGVLEIYLNQWGYVCDDGWNRIAGEVVCKQLGLNSLISYEIGVEVNAILYPFLLDDVECNGNESTIFECTHTLRHNCGSGEHVSINCSSDKIMTTPTTSTTSTLTTSTISTPTTSTTTTPTTSTTTTPTTSTTTTPTTSTTTTPTTSTTTTPTISTTTTPTTSTTTTPTTSTTTVSTSTVVTTSSPIGITPEITSPGMNITKTLNETDAAIPSIECAATGDPTPDIYWSRDLTTKFIDSQILQINITDLSTDKVFYCVAENLAGRDVVSVTFKIVLTTEEITSALEDIMDDLDEVEFISDDKSGQTADMTKIFIDASNDNVDIESEEKNKILENAATTAQIIVEKTNGTFSNETTEKITGLLSSIVNGSSGIQEPEPTVLQEGEESTVATVTSALAMTLNTLERFSQRLSEELANSEVNSVKTVVSQLITIVVQNVELESSEDRETKTEIELPMKNSDDVEYSVMVTLSTSLAAILSNDGKSLAIATSIVKRIEVKESDSSQPTQSSDILTVSLAEKSGIVELTENVKFSFDVYSNQPSDSACVFLNGTSWISDGLSTIQTTANLTNCESSHLTSFAVFVTPYKSSIGYIESIALSVISYFFVGISFIFLLISLILFIIAGKAFFKVEANIIYFNYCLSMLLATGLFVFGIQVGTYNNVLCHIIAFLLHYSWLAVFTWTLCIGILIMYKIVINVLSTKKIYKYLIIFGWGFPLLIPLITIAVARDQYVDASSHCFLNITGGVIWAFIGPILAMILINAVFLIIALIRIIRAQSSAQNNETRNIFKNALITGLVLTPVLGLPWLILIFNVTIQHSVLEWIFIIINGAMGFVFFLVVVLRNKEVLARFKRNKQVVFSNAHQSSQQTAPSSTIPISYTSSRFRMTNTLERNLVKESGIQGASTKVCEIYTSPYDTGDNIYEVVSGGKKDFEAGTPGIAEQSTVEKDNRIYRSETLDQPPIYQDLTEKEVLTEIYMNPVYSPQVVATQDDVGGLYDKADMTNSDEAVYESAK